MDMTHMIISKLRCALSVKHTGGCKDLVQKNVKYLVNTFLIDCMLKYTLDTLGWIKYI